jgi:hypothetical protein
MVLEKPKVFLLTAALLFAAALGVDSCVQTDEHRAGVFRDRVKWSSGDKWSTQTVLAERRQMADWLDAHPFDENQGEAKYYIAAAWFRVGAYAMMWGVVAAMALVVLSPLVSTGWPGRPPTHRLILVALIIYPIVLAAFWVYSNRVLIERGIPGWSLYLGLGGYLMTFLFLRDTRHLYGWRSLPIPDGGSPSPPTS